MATLLPIALSGDGGQTVLLLRHVLNGLQVTLFSPLAEISVTSHAEGTSPTPPLAITLAMLPTVVVQEFPVVEQSAPCTTR